MSHKRSARQLLIATFPQTSFDFRLVHKSRTSQHFLHRHRKPNVDVSSKLLHQPSDSRLQHRYGGWAPHGGCSPGRPEAMSGHHYAKPSTSLFSSFSPSDSRLQHRRGDSAPHGVCSSGRPEAFLGYHHLLFANTFIFRLEAAAAVRLGHPATARQ